MSDKLISNNTFRHNIKEQTQKHKQGLHSANLFLNQQLQHAGLLHAGLQCSVILPVVLCPLMLYQPDS